MVTTLSVKGEYKLTFDCCSLECFPKTTVTQHMDSITLMPPILVAQFSNHELTLMYHTSLAEEDSIAPMPAESSILLRIRAG